VAPELDVLSCAVLRLDHARRLLRHHAALAVALGVAAACVAWRWGTHVASGSDAYGYVSEAELFSRGQMQIDQSFVADVPWPLAEYTFSTLAYRPTADGLHLVPTYAPGLPLLMAGAKIVAGTCAMFAVVPILFGTLVFATYSIGRQIGRPVVGLAAAWLVATSPAVLFSAMWPMSDVPAAAMWAVSVALLVRETGTTAAWSGLAAAMAVLVRPNLVPIAAMLLLWIGWRDIATARWRDWRRVCLPWFALGASVGIVAVMIIFAQLYGSPLRSGYGDLSEKFAARWIPRNLQNYGGWLLSAETPLAVLGLVSLAVPFARCWTTPRSRAVSWLLAGCTVMTWGSYLAWLPFDAWWYLRFLLPSWPMMALGSASVAAAGYRLGHGNPWARAMAIAVLVLVGAHGVRTAISRNAFGLAAQEAAYVDAARVAAMFAGPDDVIIAREFSGSTRYYAGLLTLDVSHLAQQPEWLDRAVQWLNERGHHVYFLLNRDESWVFRREWTPRSRLAQLDWTPLMVARGGDVRLYDSVPRYLPIEPLSLPDGPPGRCYPPKPYPTLRTIAQAR